MKTDDIKLLLQRYYDGETSEQEERQLKEFFASNDVPEDMQADKKMFEELMSFGEPEMPEELNARISAAIDDKAGKHRTVRLRIFGSIAAMLCIILSVNTYLSREEVTISPKDTCSTPEEAAEQTQRALIAFSKALNKGMDGMNKAEKTTNQANRIVVEKLKKLNNR